MSSTWIDTPIENAKEVVERTVAQVPGYAAKVVTYDQDCEVYLSTYELTQAWTHDPKYVYFGYFNSSVEVSGLLLRIGDGLNEIDTWDSSVSSLGTYQRPAIWNKIDNIPLQNVSFIGYRFRVDYPVQSQQRIRIYNPIDNYLTADIGTFNTSQDDTPITFVDPDGLTFNFGSYDTPFGSPVHIEVYPQNIAPGWWEIRCDSDINYANFSYSAGQDEFDIELVACGSMTYLDISPCSSVPIPSVIKIMSQFVHFGKTNGTLNLPTGFLSQVSSHPSYQTLVDRGWTITG